MSKRTKLFASILAGVGLVNTFLIFNYGLMYIGWATTFTYVVTVIVNIVGILCSVFWYKVILK